MDGSFQKCGPKRGANPGAEEVDPSDEADGHKHAGVSSAGAVEAQDLE
jgi:hypothetical protein